MSEQALSILLQKRADLLKQIEAAEAHVRAMKASVGHLEGAVFVLDPKMDFSPKARPKRKVLKRGTISRPVLDAMRMAQKPLTTRQIIEHVQAVNSNPALTAVLAQKVRYSLRDFTKAGTVTSAKREGQLYWRLTDADT